MLLTRQLNFNFPPELVATEALARGESRIFLIPRKNQNFGEISWADFFAQFSPGDVLVLNDTKVLKARLVMGNKEVFFLKALGPHKWEVLTKGLRGKVGKEFEMPGGVKARFLETGKPAVIEVMADLNLTEYFEEHGHVPLPPYILALRESGGDEPGDVERYQTIWAKKMGSVAAPTASLHFNRTHLEEFGRRGVVIKFVTLHVGAGTFLPIEVERVDEFKIHSEWVSVSEDVAVSVAKAKASGNKVWACGTTVMRSLESWGKRNGGSISEQGAQNLGFEGDTDLFIQPGFDFKIVDGLLTNFHQPQSSLLLLAASFAGKDLQPEEAVEKIVSAYNLAIENHFRLFSYGDLTVIV